MNSVPTINDIPVSYTNEYYKLKMREWRKKNKKERETYYHVKIGSQEFIVSKKCEVKFNKITKDELSKYNTAKKINNTR